MGDHYLVNGIKNWITNATNAKTCVLFATSDKSKKHKGISALVHDMTLPGISLGKPEEKMGIRGSSTASIIYDNVKMPKDALLLNNGDGFKIAMTTLNGGRTGVAAQAIGIARASLKDALDYAKERESFGKKICEHQSIQNYLAEMVTKIDAARLLNIAAARNKDLGLPYTKEAAQAKLFASETAVWCALKGIQIFGGNGYVTDYPAERHLRDAKITEIYEGTSEIQKIVIAAQLIKE